MSIPAGAKVQCLLVRLTELGLEIDGLGEPNIDFISLVINALDIQRGGLLSLNWAQSVIVLSASDGGRCFHFPAVALDLTSSLAAPVGV
jgi:hypothetical protein